MRTEADALNNVINRKERMVTGESCNNKVWCSNVWLTSYADVLARARTAEATVQQYTTERQEFEQRSKEVEAEARERVEKEFMARVKAEAEAEALRDSVRSLRAVWQREVEAYRNEVSRMADQMRAERETAGVKRDEVMALVNKQTWVCFSTMRLTQQGRAQACCHPRGRGQRQARGCVVAVRGRGARHACPGRRARPGRRQLAPHCSVSGLALNLTFGWKLY
jgi:DNA repair exonuclease SbcCD ATPase subunit